jgi:hypothetical protein
MRTAREEINSLLDQLTEVESQQVLTLLFTIIKVKQHAHTYREDDDPFLKGIFEGAPDLAEHSIEILREASR